MHTHKIPLQNPPSSKVSYYNIKKTYIHTKFHKVWIDLYIEPLKPKREGIK